MRIAVFYDSSYHLRPIPEAEILAVIDEEQKVVEQYENPAPEMGLEAAIDGILVLGAQALIVGEGTLPKEAYEALKGKVLFMPTKYKDLYQILDNLDEVKGAATETVSSIEDTGQRGGQG
mgnify:FL=1